MISRKMRMKSSTSITTMKNDPSFLIILMKTINNRKLLSHRRFTPTDQKLTNLISTIRIKR
ncbi:hypothetical protein BC938DRAFT_475189 [Jimgerdemannia flammicorona]|uniref:Uncharacterized protein n=1 Tax=Jimgerdemannia flammicorona TaxID=994334 RepID=A0A433QRV6_9FUNG|nr:hypothetical protein BC938DRAFT_475189 [Jimgerdemannia flammicorona]